MNHARHFYWWMENHSRLAPDLLVTRRRNRGSAHAEFISRVKGCRDFSGDQVFVVFDRRGTATQDERPPAVSGFFVRVDRKL